MFQLYVSNTSLNLSSKEERVLIADSLVDNAMQQIKQVRALVSLGQISSETYSFKKDLQSGLTNMAGLYIILNTKTKKLYLGGTSNLAQRKGEYNQSLKNVQRREKLSKGIQDDLVKGNIKDFCFIPIVAISQRNFSGFKTKSTSTAQIAAFLDSEVEQKLLKYYLNETSQDSITFYNQKELGTFIPGNTSGGSTNSGSIDKPLMFQNYAWESLNAAANSLGKDRKTLRIRRDNGVFIEMTAEQFQTFQGTRISNGNAKTYFVDKSNELQTLKKQLNFRL